MSKDNLLFVTLITTGIWDLRLLALHPDTGALAWSQTFKAASGSVFAGVGKHSPFGPFFDDKSIYVYSSFGGSNSPQLETLNASDGRTLHAADMSDVVPSVVISGVVIGSISHAYGIHSRLDTVAALGTQFGFGIPRYWEASAPGLRDAPLVG